MNRKEEPKYWTDEPKNVAVHVEWEAPSGIIYKLPCCYEVCHNCNGKGTHVNRAIDGNGLTREDFDQDPDFFEAYMSGVYDVPCDECHGQRVVLCIIRMLADKEAMEEWDEHEKYLNELAAENRMRERGIQF